MPHKARYLTKSRHKLALECPTKLYYTRKKEYPDTSTEDEFLAALAEGGFQVGELAKCYYPGGHDIVGKEHEAALERTNRLLQEEDVVIYEAAIRYKNLFIRIDVLEKKGKHLRLIEVKAKSIAGDPAEAFYNKSGYLASNWKPYLYDVAFQNYVLSKAMPDHRIDNYLMLADKEQVATVDGLNQKFQLFKEGKETQVRILGDVNAAALGKPILREVEVNDELTLIFENKDSKDHPEDYDFVEDIHQLADAYAEDRKIKTPIGVKCADCQFKTDLSHKKSGFKECWKEQTKLSDEELSRDLIFDIWNFRGKKRLLEASTYKIEELEQQELGDLKPGSEGALSTKERQWLQIEKVKNKDNTPYFDATLFSLYESEWKFPYHFIDFETSMVAIPFHKGRKPYEQIAFQFSHHILQKDGRVTHKSQYLHTAKGGFPNYEFLRKLKASLSQDEGTIFRYADHENTVLNQIRDQLLSESDSIVSDKEALITFIESITSRSTDKHLGARNMVDMLKLVKELFYDPLMKGSNSIKAVLPAVLARSSEIQKKYEQPIYGESCEIPSLNFKEAMSWVQYDNDGQVIDPYKLLPPLFLEVEEAEKTAFLAGEKLAGGGAAMTAYAKMQFTEMTDKEKRLIEEGLYRYCELDTLAMVMIMQYWQIEAAKKK